MNWEHVAAALEFSLPFTLLNTDGSKIVISEASQIELCADQTAVIVHDIHHPHGRFVNVGLEKIAGIRRWDSNPAPRS